MYSANLFKKSIKLLTSPFPITLQTFFTRRALKRTFGTQRALYGQLNTQSTQAFENLRQPYAQRPLGHAGTECTQGT